MKIKIKISDGNKMGDFTNSLKKEGFRFTTEGENVIMNIVDYMVDDVLDTVWDCALYVGVDLTVNKG